MKLIKEYIQDFLSRSGSYVFFATVFSRGFSFLASFLAIQFVPNKELGMVLFSYNIILFLIPFSDLGLHQSLIRYGALLKTPEEKNNLFVFVLKKGVLISGVLTFLVVLFGLFYPFKFPESGTFLAMLSVVLIPTFLLDIIKIQFRLQHQNKLFSYVEILFSTFSVVFVLVFSYFYQENGYVIALITAPLLTAIIFFNKKKVNFPKIVPLKIINFSFWKYGFYSGLTNFVSNFLLIIDIFIIEYLLQDPEMITYYKYLSLIPLSILFLPRMFIATDFVTFTERIYNKKYIFKYIKSYMMLFLGISILFCCFSFFFAKDILGMIDPDLIPYSSSFIILTFGVCGVLIFRGLFGNLLSSIGKIEINFYIMGVAILLNIVSNYYLVPIYGIQGAAVTSAILMWFTGISSVIWFLILYKKIHSNEKN